MSRDWYDLYLLLLYIFFCYFKAIRIGGWTRLAWSIRIYNAVVGSVFLFAVVFMPSLNWPLALEEGILSVGRALMVGTILWAVVEIELARNTRWFQIAVVILVLAAVALALVASWPQPTPTGPSPSGG